MKRSREDTLFSLGPFPLHSQSGSTAGHFWSLVGALLSLQCPGITCSVSLLLLQDNFPASISCSKLRFCCVRLNWELFCANIQSADPWLGNVKLEWWLLVRRWDHLSDGDWETSRLLAGTTLSSLWAGASSGLCAWRQEVTAIWCMWGAPKSNTSSCCPDWWGISSATFLDFHSSLSGLNLYQKWCLILLNLCFDFRAATVW